MAARTKAKVTTHKLRKTLAEPSASKLKDLFAELGPNEDLARGHEDRLNLRIRPWMTREIERIAELQGKSVSSMARHMLEVGLKWYSLHAKKD
jgi:hypothetical protein